MTTPAILAPFLAGACFGLVGPAAARRLPPRRATWLISAGAIVAALSALAVLCLLGFVLVGQLPGVANEGHWSTSALEAHAPTEPGVGALSLLAALAAAVAVLLVAARRSLAVIGAYRACKDMSGAAGSLVVVTGASAGAVAVPGRPGRIVVAQSLLAALSSRERHAVLAHERAHLEHGHHWHLSAVSIAVAANPLLTPLRDAIVHATERWADEEAAWELGDRRVVAEAVVKVALLRAQAPAGVAHLAAAAHAVPQRVAALLDRPPRTRPLLSALMLALLLTAAAAAVMMEKETEHLFELAGRVYRTTHGY